MQKLYRLSTIFVGLLLFLAPIKVLAHAGHGNEFHSDTAQQSADAIQVDAETAKRLGIKVVPVAKQQLAIGIKTTGQIEALPNQKVEVTAPVDGSVVELLVKPGDRILKNQPVAVITSGELAQLRVESAEKRATAQGDIQQAQADLQLAQENLQRQREIAIAEIEQAQTELKVAQEQYDKDRDLVKVGALPRRQMLESQAHLAEAKAQLAKANSRKEVIEAENQVKRAKSALEVAKSRLNLSSAAYQTRLQQLGSIANQKGLVTVLAPISGTVANREVTLGEAVEAATKSLMTILNDSKVFVTANVYEKDLAQIKVGQSVRVKANGINSTFSGRVSVIGAAVEGETRVIPVKAELNNSRELLKQGMFADLEIITDNTATDVLAIPTSAVVEANGKQLVYIQNGNAFQPVEVTLGQTSRDLVEVKSGLFAGDLIVVQRATQLYAQSLRGGSKDETKPTETPQLIVTNNQLPWWSFILAGGGVSAIAVGAFWLGRRTNTQVYVSDDSADSLSQLAALSQDSGINHK